MARPGTPDGERQPAQGLAQPGQRLVVPLGRAARDLVGEGADEAGLLARRDPDGEGTAGLGAPLDLPQQRRLADPPRGDVDTDPAHQPLQVDQVGQPLVGLGDLDGTARDATRDLAGRVRAGLHSAEPNSSL